MRPDDASQILAFDSTAWTNVQGEALTVLEQLMRSEVRNDQLDEVRGSVPARVSVNLSDIQAHIVAALLADLHDQHVRVAISKLSESDFRDPFCFAEDEGEMRLIRLDAPFWTGKSDLEDLTKNWRKIFTKIFEAAGVEGHPLQFRHVREEALSERCTNRVCRNGVGRRRGRGSEASWRVAFYIRCGTFAARGGVFLITPILLPAVARHA